MKKWINSLVIGIDASLCLVPFNSSADLEVSAAVAIHAKADFYEPLASHGMWVDVGPYGRCWHPAHVAVEWRPYAAGQWVWTDAGWYWVSDEPWAWACYHYGEWVYDSNYGWVWVPGIEWAPAWVEWRVGGGYVGWAPLRPHGVVLVGPPLPFIFVETARFHEPLKPSTVIVNNTTILNKTTVINNIHQDTRVLGAGGAQRVFVNEGPGLAPIQKASGKTISPVPVRELAQKTPVPAGIGHRAPDSSVNPSAPERARGFDQIGPGSERRREASPDRGSFGGKGHGKGHEDR